MNLVVVGCSHHQSRVEVRERLALTELQIKPLLDHFYQAFPGSEAVLLSTCNRTELYAASRDREQLPDQADLVGLLARECGFEASQLQQELFWHTDRQAVEHLFAVAASLDSMVVGEAQILSQVKRAYQLAAEARSPIPVTHQVFQSAIRVARRISNETEIHTHRVSVPSVAIGSLARQIFETLSDKRILVIGAGEMAEETLNYVRDEGGHDIVVVNRTESRARQLADRFDGRVQAWQQLENELAVADLVVSTTGASQPIADAQTFARIDRQRREKPLFVLDLAVPRDFAAAVAEIPYVYLYTLDDLQQVCRQNQKSRENQFPMARKIIQQETDLFFSELQRRQQGSTIAQLKRQADQTKEAELQRLWGRLGDVSPQDRQEIEQAFHRLVNKLLHPPLKSLQTDHQRGGGLLEALKKLFQLED